ncbi:hypothetical protein AMTRI_Chr02g253870 [Amborella trichopoda]
MGTMKSMCRTGLAQFLCFALGRTQSYTFFVPNGAFSFWHNKKERKAGDINMGILVKKRYIFYLGVVVKENIIRAHTVVSGCGS